MAAVIALEPTQNEPVVKPIISLTTMSCSTELARAKAPTLMTFRVWNTK